MPQFGPLSVHVLGGSASFQASLFLLAAGFAVLLLAGWQTQLATSVSWCLLLSLHRRNTEINNAGDILLHLLLFWAQFLPLGAYWSLDARKSLRPRAASPRLRSVGTAAFILQVCFVYWFTAALKNDASWRTEGSAVYYALNIEQLVRPLGHWLLGFPNLLKILTLATFWFELLGPTLIFLPFRAGPTRTLAIGAFLFFHLSLGCCMRLGIFSAVCMVAWLALLPTWFWDLILARFRSRFAGAAGNDGGSSLSQDGWKPAASAFHFARLRGTSVELISAVRADGSSPVKRWAIGFLLVYVFLWNLRTVSWEKVQRYFPVQMNGLGVALGLDQHWAMFAPSPLKDDGWYVIRGILQDGGEVDLWRRGGRLSWDRPASIYRDYPNAHWQKFMMNLYDDRASTAAIWPATLPDAGRRATRGRRR